MRIPTVLLRTAALAAVLGLLSLAGCAATGPVLLDLQYQAKEGATKAPTAAVVAVSPLRDLRDAAPSVLGKREISKYRENDLVVQGTVADLAAAFLKDALRSRGFTVKDAPAWDLDAGAAPAADAAVLVGGQVKVLWVETVSRPLNVRTKAVVQVRVAAADAPSKTVFRTLNLGSSLEREDVVFTFSIVEETLAGALSAAMDQLLNDDEVKKKLFQ